MTTARFAFLFWISVGGVWAELPTRSDAKDTVVIGKKVETESDRAGNAFLDVAIRIEPADDFCGARPCNISYAISVLTAVSQFDLQSVMLQDGVMHRNREYRFEDSTVMRVAKALAPRDSKVFLGIRLFDVPDDIQDYIIVDVTNVLGKQRRTRVRFDTDEARIGVVVKHKTEAQLFEEYARRLSHQLKSNRSSLLPKNAGSCACTHRNCACCEHVKVRKLHLDDTVCVNLTYISEDLGVQFSLSVDGHVYYSKEISVRNPPPVCYEVPHLRQYASLCVELADVQFQDKHLTGCVELEANLYHIKVAKRRLGCFRIPI